MSKFICKTYDPAKPPKGKTFKYAHAKLDGIYVEIFRHPDNSVRVHTALPTDITAQVNAAGYMWWELCHSYLRYGERLHGELYAHGQSSSYVKHALVERKELEFMPFACAAPCLRPDSTLPEVRDYIHDAYKLPFAPFLHLNTMLEDHVSLLIDHWSIDTPPAKFSLEGWVFKNGNFLDWYKWKPVKTIDCVVMGVIGGEGKYFGKLGAYRVGVIFHEGFAGQPNLKEIASVSGMVDSERERENVKPPGAVMEVAYQCVGSQGRLRHPRFIRWRDDKLAIECDASQDGRLLCFATL